MIKWNFLSIKISIFIYLIFCESSNTWKNCSTGLTHLQKFSFIECYDLTSIVISYHTTSLPMTLPLDSHVHFSKIGKDSQSQRPILNFHAFGRNFTLQLVPIQHLGLLSPEFKSLIGQFNYYAGRSPNGHIQAHGAILEGHFDGVFYDNLTKYHLEPASRYNISHTASSTIVYRSIDVKKNTYSYKNDAIHIYDIRNFSSSAATKLFPSKSSESVKGLNCKVHVHLDRNIASLYSNDRELNSRLTYWFVEVNKFFETIDFKINGNTENIFVELGRIDKNIINTTNHKNIDDYLLDLARSWNVSDACLGLGFIKTNVVRKGDRNVGRSYVAKPLYPGMMGICADHNDYCRIHLNEPCFPNMMVVDVHDVPHFEITDIIIHELGHAFGASHDDLAHKENPTCNPKDEKGKFRMFSEFLPNTPRSLLFSPCSIESIRKVLEQGTCLTRRRNMKLPNCGYDIRTRKPCDCETAGPCCFNMTFVFSTTEANLRKVGVCNPSLPLGTNCCYECKITRCPNVTITSPIPISVTEQRPTTLLSYKYNLNFTTQFPKHHNTFSVGESNSSESPGEDYIKDKADIDLYTTTSIPSRTNRQNLNTSMYPFAAEPNHGDNKDAKSGKKADKKTHLLLASLLIEAIAVCALVSGVVYIFIRRRNRIEHAREQRSRQMRYMDNEVG